MQKQGKPIINNTRRAIAHQLFPNTTQSTAKHPQRSSESQLQETKASFKRFQTTLYPI
jgi:hypothetical protein